MWGYIYKQGIAPVYLGEFGTKLVDPKDAPWLQAITSYIGGDFNGDGVKDIPVGQQGISWTYWSWNPNSGDTGGILADDWRTVNQNKLAYLTPIEFNFGGASGATPHADFTVTLSAPATQTVTVAWTTVPDTADASDFYSASGTLTFAPGERSKTVSIAIVPDTLSEANEQFSVVLSSPVGATISDGTGTGTIINDDTTVTPAPVTLSVGDVSFHEGTTAAPGHGTFTISLSAASTSSVTVHYASADGTAIAGRNYVAQSGTLTFAPGEAQKTVTVTAIDDNIVTSNQNFSFLLSSPVGATISDGTGIGTIINDDVAPPPPTGGLDGHLSIVDSWNAGFNADVMVFNTGAAVTNGWQIEIDMPYQISNIWNATIVSHTAGIYVIGNAAWNGQIAHDGQIHFGFIGSGPVDPSSIQIHAVGQHDLIPLL
jgi:hypothetical protein